MKNQHIKAFLLVSVLATTLLLSCNGDQLNAAELIEGRWELKQATRNGEVVEALTDLYFEFDGEGNMQTNLPVPNPGNTYEINKNELTQQGSNGSINYTIETINESDLVLSTVLQGAPFQFKLNRSVQE